MNYKELELIPNLPHQEMQMLDYWKRINAVSKLKQLRANQEEKVYYDGPITTNGEPHYGHAITWTMKDIFPRFWEMQGYLVRRNIGWDTKGILVEYEVEKELGFKAKEEIKAYGVDKFVKYCRDFVERYKAIMYEGEARVGRWYDKTEMYSTSDASYVESLWWALKSLYEKDLVYEGHKVVAYSTRIGMTLSSHEVADGGYKEIEDPFVTAKFALLDEENTYFLAWTTTPWTLPGNLMLAANEKVSYSKVSYSGSTYILATNRISDAFKDKDFEDLGTIQISDYVGKSYKPLFNFFENKKSENCFKLITSPHATDEDGTGIVHLAPYGEEDYDIFMKLNVKMFDYLDETGHFTSLVPTYEGLFYKAANAKILADLSEKDLVFATGTLLHRMPMCYRTGEPLIYKPVKSWYVAVNKIKESMLSENRKTNWYPDHLKEGNSGMWIANARDWALSRRRYWGTPLPVWINDKTGEKIFIGSFKELETLSGMVVTDPHRPFVDEIVWEDKVNGGTFRRVEDVLDVWFDSSVMPFARWHYPFENKEQFEKSFPAEYISEGPDQVRLWFYVMHVLGVALFEQIPYKNVVTIGTMLDEKGKKLSKSKKNYKPMNEVFDEYGADALRYFILTSTIVAGADASFSAQYLAEAKKTFFFPVWNSLKYYITYANLFNFTPTPDFVPSGALDTWIVTRVSDTFSKVVENMQNYNALDAARELRPLVDDLSTWFIRRSRDRFRDGDTEALNTLFVVFDKFALLMAPFLPFFADTVYQALHPDVVSHEGSVHFELWPKVTALSSDEEKLLKDMQLVRKVCEYGHSVRKEKALKVKMPLRSITVFSAEQMLSSDLEQLIKDELNIKEVRWEVATDFNVSLDTTMDEELILEGAYRDFLREIQAKRKELGTKITDKITVNYVVDETISKVLEKYSEELKSKAGVASFVPADNFEVLLI